jgi:hypothetical protein
VGAAARAGQNQTSRLWIQECKQLTSKYPYLGAVELLSAKGIGTEERFALGRELIIEAGGDKDPIGIANAKEILPDVLKVLPELKDATARALLSMADHLGEAAADHPDTRDTFNGVVGLLSKYDSTAAERMKQHYQGAWGFGAAHGGRAAESAPSNFPPPIADKKENNNRKEVGDLVESASKLLRDSDIPNARTAAKRALNGMNDTTILAEPYLALQLADLLRQLQERSAALELETKLMDRIAAYLNYTGREILKLDYLPRLATLQQCEWNASDTLMFWPS